MDIRLLLIDICAWIIGVYTVCVQWILSLLIIRLGIMVKKCVQFPDHSIEFASIGRDLEDRILLLYYMVAKAPNIHDLNDLTTKYTNKTLLRNYITLIYENTRITLNITIDLQTKKVIVFDLAEGQWYDFRVPMGSIDVYELYRTAMRKKRQAIK